MARPRKPEKELLENLGLKITPALKAAIERESEALEITPGTYARQLLQIGWRAREGAPVAKNPREQKLIDAFNAMPINRQEDILAIIDALQIKDRSEPAVALID